MDPDTFCSTSATTSSGPWLPSACSPSSSPVLGGAAMVWPGPNVVAAALERITWILFWLVSYHSTHRWPPGAAAIPTWIACCVEEPGTVVALAAPTFHSAMCAHRMLAVGTQ